MTMKKWTMVTMAMVMTVGMLASPAQARGPQQTTLLDVALAANAETGEFSILIAAVLAADPAIAQTLDARGQRTVFAPTDAAFAALLEELNVSAEDLLGNQDLLTQVLLYHVVPGRRDAESVIGTDRLRTLQGGFILQDGGVLTDTEGREVNIIVVDILADNGIIHVIDRVLLP
jgi:uncharacterized surface protein with fasciclin (FAS1) repeats